jgi:hypothetical protein
MTHFLARLVDRARGTASRVEPIVRSRFAPAFPFVTPLANESREFETQQTPPHSKPATDSDRMEASAVPALKSESERGTAIPPNHSPARTEANQAMQTETAEETLLVPQFQEQAPLRIDQEKDTASGALVGQTSALEVDQRDVKSASKWTKRAPGSPAKSSSLGREPREHVVEPATERLLVPLEAATTETPLVVRQEGVEESATRLTRNAVVREDSLPKSVTKRSGSPTPNTAPHRALRGIERSETWPNDQPAEPPIVRVTIGRIEVRAAPEPAPAPRKPSRPVAPRLTLDAYLKSRKGGVR